MENQEDEATDEKHDNQGFSAATSFDSMNGALSGMNFPAGGFDQMQMMMAMQNGMLPNGFGSFPMMGSSTLAPPTC